ncbi:MAG: hypothetical protein IPN86_09520 [Saprospiraceae bacterium]|jgi:hypothetical protein|nr:hypothetical protein [Saprospiraceae bacterium]
MRLPFLNYLQLLIVLFTSLNSNVKPTSFKVDTLFSVLVWMGGQRFKTSVTIAVAANVGFLSIMAI